MNADRLEQLEIKIAFLERATAELSDVVLRQHRDIEALRAQIAGLIARIEAVQADDGVRTPDEERPPHY